MLRFWLTYCDLAGRLFGAVILDSWSLLKARSRAAAEGLDQGAVFYVGHELAGDAAAVIPPDAIGRMLTKEEAFSVIRRMEHAIPKRPPAISVRRSMGKRNRG